MAHLVETMAYAGATPWHGLGNQLTQKQPIEVWQREAGMDWQILESPVHFKSNAVGHLGAIHSFPEQRCSTAPTARRRCRWSHSVTTPCSPGSARILS